MTFEGKGIAQSAKKLMINHPTSPSYLKCRARPCPDVTLESKCGFALSEELWAHIASRAFRRL